MDELSSILGHTLNSKLNQIFKIYQAIQSTKTKCQPEFETFLQDLNLKRMMHQLKYNPLVVHMLPWPGALNRN